MSLKFDGISEFIKNKICKLNNKTDIYYEGLIISIVDNIIKIIGLSGVFINELIELPNNIGYALVFDLDRYSVNAISLVSFLCLEVGMKVKSTGRILDVPVGNKLLGRVVNSLGKYIDGRGDIETNIYYPIEYDCPRIIDRRSINRPLYTGYKSIDSMIPIGMGQRELIIGDRKTGKTSIALDIIINQRNFNNIKCVYVAIGQKLSTVFSLVKKLYYYNAMDYTVVIASSASDSAIMQYIAPYSGCSIAEYFRNQGDDVIIIYDDLSKHAISYRQISLLLRRPPCREAYPGDIFYIHSRLLERAAYVNYNFIKKYNVNYKKNYLTGSLTALPIVETYEEDISSFIPTNIISITDGQIFLESNLFNSGIKPAINPGISVSRVGSSAQTNIMKHLSSSIRTSLSQYYELLNFSQFSSDLDKDTINQLSYGKKVVEILKQKQYKPISYIQQVLIFFSLKYGYLKDINVCSLYDFENKLYKYFISNYFDLNIKIKLIDELDNKLISNLKNIISSFKLIYLK